MLFAQYDAFHHDLVRGKDGKPITRESAQLPTDGHQWLPISHDEDDNSVIAVFDPRNHKRGNPELVFQASTGKVIRRFPIVPK